MLYSLFQIARMVYVVDELLYNYIEQVNLQQ
jgi:hypothetical protein